MTKIIFDKLPPGAVVGDSVIDDLQTKNAELENVNANLRRQVTRQLTQILRLKRQLDVLAGCEIK